MTNVTVLMDNHVYKKRLIAEHGLSLFVSSNGKNILFDVGQSNSFIENAKVLGIDLKEVDACVISHGHYDHTGGLESFLEINEKAKVYISSLAFVERKNSSGEMIGVRNKEMLIEKYNDRFIYIEDETEIAKNIIVFRTEAKVTKISGMYANISGDWVDDPFIDEIYMLVFDENRINLFTGCSHRGIIEIAKNTLSKLNGNRLNNIIGGMHLSKIDKEETKVICKSLDELSVNEYHPMHCSGVFASMMLNPNEIIGVGSQINLR